MNPQTDTEADTQPFGETEGLTPIVASGTASQPKRLVLTDQEDIDGAQATGRWISAGSTVHSYE